MVDCWLVESQCSEGRYYVRGEMGRKASRERLYERRRAGTKVRGRLRCCHRGGGGLERAGLEQRGINGYGLMPRSGAFLHVPCRFFGVKEHVPETDGHSRGLRSTQNEAYVLIACLRYDGQGHVLIDYNVGFTLPAFAMCAEVTSRTFLSAGLCTMRYDPRL